MDWDDFRFFLAVADHGSLSGAAKELRVTHSTVFRRINTFEGKLGVRLFERLPSGYALTIAGEEVLENARRMEDESLAIEQKLVGKDFQYKGTIRVTTMEGLAMILLPPILKRFRDAYPEIRIELVISGQVFDLTRKEADVAIRMGPRDPPEHLIGRVVGKVIWSVYAAPGYLQQHGTPTSVNELRGHYVITGDGASAHRQYVKWIREHVDDKDLVFTSNVIMAQRSAAKAGIGLVLLPRYLGESSDGLVRLVDEPEGRLVRVFDVGEELDLNLWLLTHPEQQNHYRVRVFMDFVAAAIRELQPMLEGNHASSSVAR